MGRTALFAVGRSCKVWETFMGLGRVWGHYRGLWFYLLDL